MIPVGGPEPQWEYVSNLWVSFESGTDDPLPGYCGSPLFDSQGEVYAFFRYFHTDGSAASYCPCPDPLLNSGCALSSSSPPDNGNLKKEVPERYKVPVFTFLFLSLDCFFCADGGK